MIPSRPFHPPASPGLNPIGNMWAVMQQRVSKLPNHPEMVDKLWQAVQRFWDKLSRMTFTMQFVTCQGVGRT